MLTGCCGQDLKEEATEPNPCLQEGRREGEGEGGEEGRGEGGRQVSLTPQHSLRDAWPLLPQSAFCTTSHRGRLRSPVRVRLWNVLRILQPCRSSPQESSVSALPGCTVSARLCVCPSRRLGASPGLSTRKQYVQAVSQVQSGSGAPGVPATYLDVAHITQTGVHTPTARATVSFKTRLSSLTCYIRAIFITTDGCQTRLKFFMKSKY